MRQVITRFLGILTVLAFAGCRPPEAQPFHVVVAGSRCMEPLLTDIAARFESRHLDVRVSVESGPADRAVSDTRQGLADVGMLDRELHANESDLLAVPFAQDGVAFVAHPANPVTGLTEPQVAGLLRRSYINWKDLGGSSIPFVLIAQGDGDPLREVLMRRYDLRPAAMKPDAVVSTSEQVLQGVANQPAAIGYVSLAAALTHETEPPVRVLSCGGVAATLANVRAGRYPLVRPLLLLCRKPANERVLQFTRFASSVEVHDLIQKHGFVPASQ